MMMQRSQVFVRQDLFDFTHERRDVVRDYVPDDVVINRDVVVDEFVPHSAIARHSTPGYLFLTCSEMCLTASLIISRLRTTARLSVSSRSNDSRSRPALVCCRNSASS